MPHDPKNGDYPPLRSASIEEGWRKPVKSGDSGGDELAQALPHTCRFQLLRSVLPLVQLPTYLGQ